MMLEKWFCEFPESTAFILFDDYGEIHEITKRELLTGSTHCANYLKGNGVRAFMHVVLVLPHSVELLYWFFGCFLVGAIPSILAPSDRGKERQWGQLCRAASHIDAGLVITGKWANEFREQAFKTGFRLLVTEKSEQHSDVYPAFQFDEANLNGYVQFTSGSTGIRKAVVLSGNAIRAYVQNMAARLSLEMKDIVVSCLPLSHDFGLFGGVLMPFVSGIPSVLISPSRWVRRPALLFQAIHNFGGTISWLPNSGFVHCARFVQAREMAGIDLSRLRVIINGAEPILHSSNELFLDRFKEYGFKESALLTGYGMAENTLGVTISMPGKRASVVFIHGADLTNKGIVRIIPEEDQNSVAVVSCGQPLRGTKIRVIGTEGEVLPEFHVGEIVIQSESLFSGYTGDKVSTARALADGWFHTGDLGFMIGNDLFFSGRMKDLIIVGGRNISPVELERVAAEVPGVRSGQVVAFGVPDESLGTERIVIVCAVRMSEHSETKDTLVRKIRQHIAGKTGISVSEVRLVRKGWIEKTGNGKLARSRNQEKYVREGTNGNG